MEAIERDKIIGGQLTPILDRFNNHINRESYAELQKFLQDTQVKIEHIIIKGESK